MNSKADILQGAYSQMRISGLTVQPTPEDASLGIIRLEDMMDEFFGRGLCVGFNFEEVPNLTTPHGMARKYRQMAQTNLAMRLVPDFNKVIPQQLIAQAKQSYAFAIGAATLENMREVQAPRRMPRGSGNTLRYNRWQRFNRPAALPDNVCATNNMIAGDVNDFVELFDPYLEGETIQTYSIEATSALRIVTSSNDTTKVIYRIEALNPATSGMGQSVVIVVTSSTGRKHTHSIGFTIESSRNFCSSSAIAGQAVAGCAIAG